MQVGQDLMANNKKMSKLKNSFHFSSWDIKTYPLIKDSVEFNSECEIISIDYYEVEIKLKLYDNAVVKGIII